MQPYSNYSSMLWGVSWLPQECDQPPTALSSALWSGKQHPCSYKNCNKFISLRLDKLRLIVCITSILYTNINFSSWVDRWLIWTTYSWGSMAVSSGCRSSPGSPLKRMNTTVGLQVQAAEANRLKQEKQGKVKWKRWGPYLSERQWATVREDCSKDCNW